MKAKFAKIICATDFSDFSNQVVSYGITLAREEFNSKLYVCYVIDMPVAPIFDETMFDPLEQHNRFVEMAYEKLNSLVDDDSINWEPRIQTGHVADEIVRMAKKEKADLVICATHGRSGLRRLILGSVTERLMHTLTCPLLIVHSQEQDLASLTYGKSKIQKVLVGLDFSPVSMEALEYSLSLAQKFQSELHVVHVIEPDDYKTVLDSNIKNDQGIESKLRQRLTEKLETMIPKEAVLWCTPKTVVFSGHPHDELTKYALSNSINVIILGVHGHGVFERFLVGSTTDRVVRKAHCPVLLVRPPAV